MIPTSLYWIASFLAVGVLILLLRWAYSRGHSLIEGPARAGYEDEYGLLVPVSAPGTFIEGEMLRQKLQESGIKASVVSTLDGPRVMVFPRDQKSARAILKS